MEQRWLEEAKTGVGFCKSLVLYPKKNLADILYLFDILARRSDLHQLPRDHLLQVISCELDYRNTSQKRM